MTTAIPKTQQAVQLVGPDVLEINNAKEVFTPGPHQLLGKIEVVGLCFSDLKLLKQFTGHVRKSEIISGIDPKVLAQIPSYVPGDKPAVPGHELVVRIVATGPDTRHKVGERALVQTDYRWLKTAASNAAFGYNFEGGLQEYVLMDERVITSDEGESMLIPIDEKRSASAVALVEPWACVENAYISPERTTAKPGGRMLVVADAGRTPKGVSSTFAPGQPPASLTTLFAEGVTCEGKCGITPTKVSSLAELSGQSFDDIIYFGSNPDTIEALDKMLGFRGCLNVVLGGARIGRLVSMGIGRVHYGFMRYIGTTGDDAGESMKTIPATPEIRKNDKILVIGAAGPMGLMHVIRDICQGVEGVSIVATDFDDARLAMLDKKAEKLAVANKVAYKSVNPSKDKSPIEATYTVLMVPVPALAAKAIGDSLPNGIINIFAGIAATVCHEIDLDTYIAKKLYFIGTSGSLLRDMHIVLKKVLDGKLDTNLSVAAVTGIPGAIDGIRATENRTIAGKIMVYPELHNLGLTELTTLAEKFPSVAAKLADGEWSGEAEQELLKVAK